LAKDKKAGKYTEKTVGGHRWRIYLDSRTHNNLQKKTKTLANIAFSCSTTQFIKLAKPMSTELLN